MALLLCPTCNHPITAVDMAPNFCSRCGTALPQTLVAAAQEELRRHPASKPTLLRVLPAFLGFCALLALPMSLTLLFSDGGTYTINDREVTRDEFMHRVGGVFAVFPVLAVLAGIAAWGLYRDRAWSRPFTVSLFLIAAVSPLAAFARDPELSAAWPAGLGFVLLFAIPLLWYFYYKRNVVRYYAALSASARGTTTLPPAA